MDVLICIVTMPILKVILEVIDHLMCVLLDPTVGSRFWTYASDIIIVTLGCFHHLCGLVFESISYGVPIGLLFWVVALMMMHWSEYFVISLETFPTLQHWMQHPK